ncbi:MAG: histidine phosphatase family protein [Sulfitobacter sp.]
MADKIRYITHPQVLIHPAQDIQKWSLNEVGHARVTSLAASGALNGAKTVISSAETKAIETARPLAAALGCELTIRDDMHENDRSATGYLPPDAFEAAADQFFAHPTVSHRGWETAAAAQNRIVTAFLNALTSVPSGDVVFVGHGAVGTLLYCHLAKLPISRAYDQTPGGGCFFEITDINAPPISGWRAIETLIR